MKRYDFLAWKKGACIVTGACFDSLPSDASAYISVQTIKALLGPEAKVGNCTSAFTFRGGFSGGSAATIMSAFDEVPSRMVKRGSIRYALSPGMSLEMYGSYTLFSPPSSDRTTPS